MATLLTKEVLRESMKSGVSGVRDVLRREQPGIQGQQPKDFERAEQVQRAKRAAEILRFELNEMNASEKKVIVEAGRQIIQDALTSVSNELQGQSGEQLKILQAEQEKYLRAKEQMLELEKNLAALHERVALEAREFGIDVRDASTEKKIGYAIAGFAGFALAHKVWSSITGFVWGDKEKPGYLRRVLTFLAGVGGAIAGAVGLNALLRTKIGAEVAQYAGDVPTSLKKGLGESPLVKDTIPAVKETLGNGAVAAIEEKRKKGEIPRDDEYYTALALAYLKDGYVIVGVGADHFWKSGETLALKNTPQLWEATKNIISDPHDLWKAHWESVAIYGTSFGAVQTAMLMARDGILPGIKAGALKTVTWEVQLLKAGGSATLGLFNHDARMIKSASYLEWKSTLGYRRNRFAHYFGWRTRNSETLVDLMDEYRQYNNFISQLHDVKSAQGIVERFKVRTRAIRSNIGNCLFTMRQSAKNVDELNAITQEVDNLLGSKVAQQLKMARKVGDIDDALLVEELPAALRNMNAIDVAETATTGKTAANAAGAIEQPQLKIADTPDEAIRTSKATDATVEASGSAAKGQAPEGSVMRQAAGGEVVEGKPLTKPVPAPDQPPLKVFNPDAADAAKGVATAEALSTVEETRWKQLLSKFGSGDEALHVRAFLEAASEQKLINLDAEVFALIKESPGAQKIIAGAVQTGDVSEIARAMNAASAARNFRVGLNVVGAVGDGFGAYMAYRDYMANGSRIETALAKTKNPALVELYKNANYMYAAEGTQGAAGLAIGGIAIVKAAVGGETFLTALGTSGGLIMLPVAAATLSGGFVYRKAEGVTETWLRNAKDWEKSLSPGEILEKLKELGPGQRGYWQGWAQGTVAEQIGRLQSAGETGDVDAYRRWEEEGGQRIEKANEGTRVELTKAYVVKTSLLAKKPRETDEQYKRRFDLYVMDQMEYLGRMTEGSFSYMLGDTYANARKYAEMLSQMRDEGKKPEALPWKNAAEPTDKQRAIQEYVPRERQQKILQFNLMQRMRTQLSPEQKRTVAKQDLILACQDGLLKLDGRIASTDFEGTGETEIIGEALARFTASELFRERLAEQADQLLAEAAKPEGLTSLSYAAIVNKLGTVLETDPLQLQRIGWQRRYISDGRVTNAEAAKNFLTAEYQLQSLQQEQETVRAVAKEKTLSAEALQKECYDKGRLLLLERGASQNGEKFQLQMGWIFNRYLYARFIEGQWQVGLNQGYIKWENPEGYSVKGLVNSWGGIDPKIAGKYNEVIRELAAINKRYGRNKQEKKAA